MSFFKIAGPCWGGGPVYERALYIWIFENAIVLNPPKPLQLLKLHLPLHYNFVISDNEYKTRWMQQPWRSLCKIGKSGQFNARRHRAREDGGETTFHPRWSEKKPKIAHNSLIFLPVYLSCVKHSSPALPLQLNFCQLWNLKSAHSYIFIHFTSSYVFVQCVQSMNIYISKERKGGRTAY